MNARRYCSLIAALYISLCLFYSQSAQADTVNEFVQVQCIKDLNTLKINTFGANGEIAAKRSHDNQKNLWKTHGIREIRTMVDYIRLHNDDGTPSEDPRDTRMIVKDPIQTSCTLIEERPDGTQAPRTYDIHIEPYFFNTNPNGECGGVFTFSVTIKQNDDILIDNLPFWHRCRINPWISDREIEGRKNEHIDSIELHPSNDHLIFSGSYLDTDDYICDGAKNACSQNKHIYVDAFKIFYLDKDMPITAKKLYITDPLQANYE